MSDRTLFFAQVKASGMPCKLRIEVGNRVDLPFTLECDRDRRGSPYYLELPLRYQTARGAKLAAMRIVGEPLTWTEPTDAQPTLPRNIDQWNPAMRGAYMKGRKAQLSGEPIEACPYKDKRKDDGRLSWSRAFISAWVDGWRDAQQLG